MPSRHVVAAATLLSAVALNDAFAQQRVPDVGVELVRLDVVVTDASGRLVRDLTQADFVLLEDGKPQRLSNFLLAGRPAPAAAPAAPPPAGEPAAQAPASAGPGRAIVIVVDDLHIAAANVEHARQALRRFVAEQAEADDSLALVAISGSPVVPELTRDRAALEQAIGRIGARADVAAPARGTQMTPGQAELILRGDRSARQLAGRTAISEPGSILETSTPRAAVEAPAGSAAAASASAAVDPDTKDKFAEAQAERQARGVLTEALRLSVATLSTTEAVLRSLAPVQGRKLCLLVSDGFLVGAGTGEGRQAELQRIVDAATRSGAVVYTLDPRGLGSASTDASVSGSGVPPGLQARVDRQVEQIQRTTLEGLANDTGGFLIRGTNDLAAGLKRMLQDNDAYYLLAYEPANTKRDGRFRKIAVRVPGRPGVVVRTRTGYFAPDDRKRGASPGLLAAAALAPTGAIDESEARQALELPVPEQGLAVRLSADYVELPPAGPQAVVRAHLELEKLRWQALAGRKQAAFDLVGAVYDANGTLVGVPFGKHNELSLGPAEFERAAREGLRYQQQLALAPGRYQVRLLAREPHGPVLGGAAQWLEIPDLGARQLALSSVFLSSSAAGASQTDALRDAQALRRFQHGEALVFQLYVYNPSVDEKGASDVVLQAQVRSGTSVVAVSKPQPVVFRQQGSVPLPETNSIPLQALSPGSYDLRIVVVDRKTNATAFRQVDFSVE